MSQFNIPPSDSEAPATREEIMSALFAHMVIQQTNMSMMLLGKVAHPQTGKFIHDLESAKLLIDQLEMLEEKTKGNLSKEESELLKQALAALHMAFVEVIDQPPTDDSAAVTEGQPASSPTQQVPSPESAKSAPAPAPEIAPDSNKEAPDDSRKRFTKKY